MKKQQIKWRDGALGMKEFYSLSKEEKNKYIEFILNIPVEDRGSSDDHIINFYGPKVNNHFIKFED